MSDGRNTTFIEQLLNMGKNAMRGGDLNSILNELYASSEDIEACGVVSTDGLMMAAQLPADMDEERVGAMSAAMMFLGERTTQELARGRLRQVLVKGDDGYVLMVHAGADAVVTVVSNPNANLGLVFLDATRAAESIAKLV